MLAKVLTNSIGRLRNFALLNDRERPFPAVQLSRKRTLPMGDWLPVRQITHCGGAWQPPFLTLPRL